ncbi:hypothetical protein LAZ67_2003001 [Cordylochernes scorpioides]|uniref:Uncharacterized protein n=1 Tax=Cordylochernes scorpioides TaxID=51811 RepID=A0ABY6K5B5_9ARAC|nr:hypothetical protein LAZ67_2003001 [Cordylochernes scorpioides]
MWLYLLQATTENSVAREVVESFPPSADNYPKVIDYLKSRFGENEMLVEMDKHASMLYPLVKPALPEDTLKVWARTQVEATLGAAGQKP